MVFAAFVPGYSGGTATDLHRFPYSSSATTSRERHLASKGLNLTRPRRLSIRQIAAFGSTHFYVWKENASEQTRAQIRKLDDEESRVQEIARMLGGEKIAASAVAHARELLDTARSRGKKTAGTRG